MSSIVESERKRVAPWIGCGTAGTWDDYEEALHDCGLLFKVEGREAWVKNGSLFGTVYEEVPGIKVNMNIDDGKILGTVSNAYSIVQNREAFSVLEPFVKAGGVITHGGMTEQGLCFMVARMNQMKILGNDYDFDVMVTNSFNGAFPCAMIVSPIRIVCQNMYRKLMKNDKLFGIRHTSLANEKLAIASRALGQITRYESAFDSTMQMLNFKSLPASTMEEFLLPLVFPYPKQAENMEQAKKRVDDLRQEFMDVRYAAPDNVRFHGRATGFVHAYYDHLTHREPQRNNGNWADRRLSGLVSGNDVKMKVLDRVLEL